MFSCSISILGAVSVPTEYTDSFNTMLHQVEEAHMMEFQQFNAIWDKKVYAP